MGKPGLHRQSVGFEEREGVVIVEAAVVAVVALPVAGAGQAAVEGVMAAEEQAESLPPAVWKRTMSDIWVPTPA